MGRLGVARANAVVGKHQNLPLRVAYPTNYYYYNYYFCYYYYYYYYYYITRFGTFTKKVDCPGAVVNTTDTTL
jgi:hypothetical protein